MKVIILTIVLSLVLIPSVHSYHTENDWEKQCVITVEQFSCEPTVNPVFYSILKFLGSAYASYKLEAIFPQLEDRLAEYVHHHLRRVWDNYDALSTDQECHAAFKQHYNNCQACHQVGQLLTDEDLARNNLELTKQINSVNRANQEQIRRLETLLEEELKNINARFISLEIGLQQTEVRTMDNANKIEEQARQIAALEKKVSEHDKTIKKLTKPKVVVFRSKGDAYVNYKTIIDPNDKFQLIEQDISVQGKARVIVVNEHFWEDARNISLAHNLPLLRYKESGLFGINGYDVIIFM